MLYSAKLTNARSCIQYVKNRNNNIIELKFSGPYQV